MHFTLYARRLTQQEGARAAVLQARPQVEGFVVFHIDNAGFWPTESDFFFFHIRADEKKRKIAEMKEIISPEQRLLHRRGAGESER